MARREYNIITGQTIELPDHPPEASDPAEVQAVYIRALDAFIDAESQTHGYDNRITCALRSGYPGPYRAEGTAFAIWVDTCYQLGTTAMAEVLAGQRPMPTVAGFLAELPPMVWPT